MIKECRRESFLTIDTEVMEPSNICLRRFGLLLFVTVSVINGGIVPNENQCPSGGGTLRQIRVTDCSGYPCRIQRQKEYTAEIDFTPSRNTTKMSIKCDTMLNGRPYKIPDHPICPDVKPNCPLNNATSYTYKVKFNVPYVIPPGDYPIRCSFLDDTKVEQLCISGRGQIV